MPPTFAACWRAEESNPPCRVLGPCQSRHTGGAWPGPWVTHSLRRARNLAPARRARPRARTPLPEDPSDRVSGPASAARLARPCLDADELAGAQDAQRDGAFARPAAEQAMKVVHAAGRLSVRGDDDVARGHTRRGRWAAALDPHHLDARVLGEPEPPRGAARERAVLTGDAEVAAAHAADGHELPEHPLGGVDRDAEAQALRTEDHRRVDADHAPWAVDQRPARVARVERHVALDDALHQAPRGGAHGAPERAHHARRYGGAEAERVTDRDHELADAELGRAAELGVGKPAPIDGDDRAIGGLVGPDDRRPE